MKHSKMPECYIGKEQAYVKHAILRTYLQRLFMIVGQSKEAVINYVDCFAGPWQEEDDKLSDTSIGISLEQMALCEKALKEQFNRTVSFRALYIEKDPRSFEKLQTFLASQPYKNIDVACLNGDYTELLTDIVKWCQNHFTFFFVDPTGWQKVVGANTMLPLLRFENAEFLINLMYDFINRFVSLDKHSEDMVELFGEVPSFEGESPEQRQSILLNLYRGNLKNQYRGRTTFVPVKKPGKNRVHYYLVYLTRHPRGIDIFKNEAEDMEIVQRIVQKEYKLRKQLEQSDTIDMFGDDVSVALSQQDYSDNRYAAKECLLKQLSNGVILIDYEKWADFLEDTDLYPSDFQVAMKDLFEEGRVKNLDADVGRRRTKIIRPDWRNKSERWELV